MSSRSSSSSTFASSTFSLSTTTTSTSLHSTSRPSPPPRYSAHFTHLSPYSTTVDTSKPLPPSPSHHQEEEEEEEQQQQPKDLHQQQQSPRWTPLSSHGLPRSPVPGQVLYRSRTRRPRASSVSELPTTITTSEPTDLGSMGTSVEYEKARAPRSQSRPAARHPYVQQSYTPGHRQAQSLGRPQHYQHHHHHDYRDQHQHDYGNHYHSTTAAVERHRQEDAGTTTDAAAASASREPSGSTSKLKQLRTRVATSCAGWRERERERRRLATEDVVEVGRGGHWSEY